MILTKFIEFIVSLKILDKKEKNNKRSSLLLLQIRIIILEKITYNSFKMHLQRKRGEKKIINPA